ncbi:MULTISPECIES: DNA recombination protein RmuC [Alteromonadaceae]|jgi:DNA recombination protein RmuC|uniref:DNA recombination protein RmuC n=1 Tax=Brumicola blandensis TaxID=3075611 RepID=A0AAW8R1C0_9ALTE|nr:MULTISPECIES: DNA recombination protein RmuC [unclassified Alteromonas]MDT0581640.1 DNA recombination protein RmuC [Alteromonas sp. W409]MDT0627215.1 DNA recombination protein RmuC [Alteromonas sp. W364]
MITPYLNQEVAIAAGASALFIIVVAYFILRAKHNALINLSHEKALLQQAFDQKQSELVEVLRKSQQVEDDYSMKLEAERMFIADNQREIGILSQKADELVRQQKENDVLKKQIDSVSKELGDLQAKFQSQQASFNQERVNFSEKLSLLENAEKQLSTQFENLANKIFEQKSEKFTKTSQLGIDQLLSPLKDQIETFKKQISDQYVKEGQERASLKTEILGLKELNKQITEEASALTNALKGDNKIQGNWGELVLERILKESGLRKGHEYETQKSLKDDAGKRYQPDVVVHLPNDKDIVIDSKVSLIAHEKLVNAENDESKQLAIKEHILSVRGHIKGLSKKDYQDLQGVRTLDYVLMFIPIESAFISAIEHEPQLIKFALDNQIMLVSPTNLLVALRTINNIWQYEYQNQNANKIAEQARKMYDKFHGFVGDMDKIGRNIEASAKAFESAMSKLSTGRGNLVRQAEQFKSLGVSPTKSLDQKLLDESTEDD